ncbi:AAA family ATPase [Candidatus Daviesbacteria bacterium]|nr:AAA family ATPase [Candidatus Daviesbacteria bacterium]
MNNFILLITGPAGAGKSSVADSWAKKQKIPTIHLSLDQFRYFVKSGLVDPQEGWSEETKRQLSLAQKSCAEVVKIYLAEGYNCVIDDAVFPEWEEAGLDNWKQVLGPVAMKVVVLMPSFDALIRRNFLREGEEKLSDEMVKTIYEMMESWKDKEEVVIDNSNLTVEQTVEELEKRLV